MKTIEQFQPYQQAKQNMQMACMGRQLACALMHLLRIEPTMALAPLLGQELGLCNQAAMEAWVGEEMKNMEAESSEEMLNNLIKIFMRQMSNLGL